MKNIARTVQQADAAMTNMAKTVDRVEQLVRFMYAHQHPGKKLEIDRQMLELDIIKHACIKVAFDEIPYEEGGVK